LHVELLTQLKPRDELPEEGDSVRNYIYRYPESEASFGYPVLFGPRSGEGRYRPNTIPSEKRSSDGNLRK